MGSSNINISTASRIIVRHKTHKVLSLMLDDARKVKDKELEAVTVRAGKLIDSSKHSCGLLF